MTDALKSVSYRDGPLTAADYDEAIEALQNARVQDQTAPVCCAICTDGSHTAESCHHNPLALARRWARATNVWACYHCGFTATTGQEAHEHFGGCDQDEPACIAALKARVGELEGALRAVVELNASVQTEEGIGFHSDSPTFERARAALKQEQPE